MLVHGLATTRIIWRRVVPRLARTRRLIIVDLPGFGASPPAGDGFELDAVADVIAAHVPAATFDLVGHSLGGAVAITLADRHPDAVQRLVLVAPAGLRPLPGAAARVAGFAVARAIPVRRLGAPLADLSWGRRLLMSPGTSNPTELPPAEVRAMLHASAGATRIAPALHAAATADLRDRIPDGTRVIWGDRDRIVPSVELASLPTIRLPTGHIPMMERPEVFARALEALLSPAGNTGTRDAA